MQNDASDPDKTLQLERAGDFGPAIGEGKGKAAALYTEQTAPTHARHILALPPELIDGILSYLSPNDLIRVSETCRTLCRHARTDHLWQAQVQANVPVQRITSSYPYTSFHDLFKAHSPRWFLPRYKIWFSDTGLPGRLILVRYDQQRGCIEGYQLVANKRDQSFQTWQLDDGEAIIPTFDPEVRLHLDNPVLRLPADPLQDFYDTEDVVVAFKLQEADGGDKEKVNFLEACSSRSRAHSAGPWGGGGSFQSEIPMRLSSIGQLRNSFIYARCLPPDDVATCLTGDFPYNHVWPAPTIPTRHRVLGAGVARSTSLRPKDAAASRREVCKWAFRTRKWIGRSGFIPLGGTWEGPPSRTRDDLDELPFPPSNSPFAPLEQPVRLGEEISTYATLDPALYTPTPAKPFRGIFVGDYGPHNCEFLWVHQPDGDDEADGNASNQGDLPRSEDESDEDYAARKYNAAIYRGRLEAVKLTGDANVPRGECSFVAEDLGDRGFVRTANEPPFQGARVVRSTGHIANNGFSQHTYVPSQLLLISPDLLAHNWIALGHVSYYKRVDIDKFLA